MSDIQKTFRMIMNEVLGIAPLATRNLKPAAKEEELADLRNTISYIPEELIHLLSLHNGEKDESYLSVFPYGMQLMDIVCIKESYQQQFDLEAEGEPDDFDIEGYVKPICFSSKRIPFAQFNGDVILYIDLDPAEGGQVGQIVRQDAEGCTLSVIAISLQDFLNQYLTDLKKGVFCSDEEGCVTLLSEGGEYRKYMV